ncbi:MAG: DNA-binding response regulator [Chloroflexi bacterium]|nr:MAG: DNA-binding response regulator [SAR202 cluster bacterium]MBA13785.1 DNA-binding response regulator [Chloroflexota bacterium]|tara:strand:- start:913 stop:1590 length:678 start_codon:yes stop_codon:yes gene_type:complete
MTSLQHNFDDSTANKVTAILSQENINSFIIQSNEDVTQFSNNNFESNYDVIIIDTFSISYDAFQKIVLQSNSNEIPSLAIISPESLLMLKDSEISDFITTPIKLSELITRCQRITKRTNNVSTEKLIKFGDLLINPDNYEVKIKGNRVNLRFKEYELLLLLASNPGRVYDRASLLNQIWGYDYFGGTRTVDVHIRRLRSKIEVLPDTEYIETIWNVGYRFTEKTE